MIDLAIITAIVTRDRVADQFTGPAVTAAAARGLVRRAVVQAPRAVADRLEPATRVIPRLDLDGGRVVNGTNPGA
jgi:hypothetical protein